MLTSPCFPGNLAPHLLSSRFVVVFYHHDCRLFGQNPEPLCITPGETLNAVLGGI